MESDLHQKVIKPWVAMKLLKKQEHSKLKE